MGLDKFLTPNNHGCCNEGLDWNNRYQHYFVELLFNVTNEILNIDNWGAGISFRVRISLRVARNFIKLTISGVVIIQN